MSADLTRRTAALRAVQAVNSEYNRQAFTRDISVRAKMGERAAHAQFCGMVSEELAEFDGRGVWLTEKGVAALDRDRPLRVPEELLVTNSEWKD